MIGIDGQYIIKFKIGDKDNFILEEDLLFFKLTEQTGNTLPQFELHFKTFNESILSLLHEGNDIEVSLGKTRDSMVDVKLVPTRINPTAPGENQLGISCVGLYSALPYLNSDKVRILSARSGVEAIKEIAKAYFNIRRGFNVDRSLDSMKWVQAAITDRSFINQIWMHTDLGQSFPAVSISSFGEFIVKDIKKSLKDDYLWRFTTDPQERRDVMYAPGKTIDINTGFLNNWLGYARNKTIYDLEGGTESVTIEDSKPITALTKEVAKRSSIEKRYASAGIQNENVHPTWHQSHLRNLTNLAMMGSVKYTLSTESAFFPVRTLDLVMFKDAELSTENPNSSEWSSGLFFVSKVARIIQNKKFATVVEICRESLNQMKGEFLPKTVDTSLIVAPPAPTAEELLIAEVKKMFPTRFP